MIERMESSLLDLITQYKFDLRKIILTDAELKIRIMFHKQKTMQRKTTRTFAYTTKKVNKIFSSLYFQTLN